MRRVLGFSLVELMITVGIIGILLMVAVPQVRRSQRAAQEAELRADLRAWREAVDRFYLDHGVNPWNLGWLTHDKVGGPASGYDRLGNLVPINQYAANFRGPYIRMPAAKRTISPFFGSHGEWFPRTGMPGVGFTYTGAPNAAGELVWLTGPGTTLDGVPYSSL